MRIASVVLLFSVLCTLSFGQVQQTCTCQLYETLPDYQWSIKYSGGGVTPDGTCTDCSTSANPLALASVCNYEVASQPMVLQTACNPVQNKTWVGTYSIQEGSTCLTLPNGMLGQCFPPCDNTQCNCLQGHVHIEEDTENTVLVTFTMNLMSGYNLSGVVTLTAPFTMQGNGAGVLMSGVFAEVGLGWDVIREGDNSLSFIAWEGVDGVVHTCQQTAVIPSSTSTLLLVALLAGAGVIIIVAVWYCCFRKRNTSKGPDTTATAKNPQIQANSAPYMILPAEKRINRMG